MEKAHEADLLAIFFCLSLGSAQSPDSFNEKDSYKRDEGVFDLSFNILDSIMQRSLYLCRAIGRIVYDFGNDISMVWCNVAMG
jgi:hypothetical protein